MTGIRDKAEDTGEVVLMADLAGRRGRVLGAELYDAESLSPEDDFPRFGEFLHIEPLDRDTDEEWWECPTAMAKGVVRAVENAGRDEIADAVIQVTSLSKTADGSWQVAVELAERPESNGSD